MDYSILNKTPDVAQAVVVGYLDTNSNFVPASALAPIPMGGSGDSGTLTKAVVTMTGASAALVSASATRLSVIVSNPAGNAPAAIDPTGGTASLTAGIPIGPGQTVEITGKAAQSAMTQIGTNTQILTVYTGA